MTVSPVASLLRLITGLYLVGVSVVWVVATEPTTRVLWNLGSVPFTRIDTASLPLLAAGTLIALLAVVARHAWAAHTATALLLAAGGFGWGSLWWLNADPLGEGTVLAQMSDTHGLTQSDVLAAPFVVISLVAGALGVVTLWRAARLRPRGPARPDS